MGGGTLLQVPNAWFCISGTTADRYIHWVIGRWGKMADHDWVMHQTAIIDPGAIIGAGTRIWHWTHVSSGAEIGADCSLGQSVFIAGGVRIGNAVRIQNNVSVYEGVTLEDGVFCGPSMVFTNVLNPRAEIPRKHEYRLTLPLLPHMAADAVDHVVEALESSL